MSASYLLFLLLEEGDPVREQAVVLLSALASDLRGDELTVQRLVVIVLVNVQVNLLLLLGLKGTLLTRRNLLEGASLPARRASVVLLSHSSRHYLPF